MLGINYDSHRLVMVWSCHVLGLHWSGKRLDIRGAVNWLGKIMGRALHGQ
jgi:hypothetical protein